MKLAKLIKSVIVFVSLSFVVSAQAAPASQIIPYYGEEFYNDLKSGVTNEQLVNRLRTILMSNHTASPGAMDIVSRSCQTGKGTCYNHRALEYRAARVFLLGGYYLTKTTDGYSVHDVYCNTERTRADFPSQPPSPGQIPNNNVMNVEHTWPQSHFTGNFPEEYQKSDLHHLFPSDSRVNAIRGNYMFGEVTRELKPIECSDARFGLGSAGNDEVFEPPKNHKGNVARALFYFSTRYDTKIDQREEVILRKWNLEDPVDADEMNRNNEIFKVQGNRNPFVDFPELAERISNF